MKRFRFKKIDAFTGPGSPGNPAGCIYPENAGDITGEEMLAVARQLKGFVSEVAYVFGDGDRFSLRYFSSEREVAFCGHATIAAVYDLFHSDNVIAGLDKAAIRVGSNLLDVWNEGNGGVFIASPEPEFLPARVHVDDVLRPMHISGADLDNRYAISLVRCGLSAILVPMRKVSALTDVAPDAEMLADFCARQQIDIAVLFTDDRILPGSHYRTRVFAPRFGYLEDPATGSGNAALGHWLLKVGAWSGSPLVIEQGTSWRYPNIVRLKTLDAGGKTAVLFGGNATVRIDGWYQLQ